MKILYLHGLRERGGIILEYLKTKTPYQILTPTLNPWKPANTFKEISEIRSDYIIGFSMGGFFGSCLQTSTPKLLINPALCFPDIVSSRKNKNPNLMAEYSGLTPWMESNVKAIFTTEDHKIGLRSLPLYLGFYPESTITYLPGGHNPGEEVINILKKFLKVVT